MPGDQEDKEFGLGFLGFKKRERIWAILNTPSDLKGEKDIGFLDEVRGQELGINGSFEGRPTSGMVTSFLRVGQGQWDFFWLHFYMEAWLYSQKTTQSKQTTMNTNRTLGFAPKFVICNLLGFCFMSPTAGHAKIGVHQMTHLINNYLMEGMDQRTCGVGKAQGRLSLVDGIEALLSICCPLCSLRQLKKPCIASQSWQVILYLDQSYPCCGLSFVPGHSRDTKLAQ